MICDNFTLGVASMALATTVVLLVVMIRNSQGTDQD